MRRMRLWGTTAPTRNRVSVQGAATAVWSVYLLSCLYSVLPEQCSNIKNKYKKYWCFSLCSWDAGCNSKAAFPPLFFAHLVFCGFFHVWQALLTCVICGCRLWPRASICEWVWLDVGLYYWGTESRYFLPFFLHLIERQLEEWTLWFKYFPRAQNQANF